MEIRGKVLTDVLVIGGGGAGARAALEASKKGANVILVDKGEFGKSGSTSYGVAEVAGFNVADGAVDPDDNPEQHFQDIMAAALGTCDPKLARIVAEEAPLAIKDLESFGVVFEKNDNEKYVEVKGCFASRPRMHIIKEHGVPIIKSLSEQIKKTQVKIINQTRVMDLLVDNGVCFGAICLGSDGEFMVFEAKATILTAGGAGQIFRYTLNPPAITGDGYALGWRAGAKLINMEFMQSGVGIVDPFTSMLSAWLWEGKPRLYNDKKEEFLPSYIPKGVAPADCIQEKSKHMPFTSRDPSKYVDIAIQSELIRREKENGAIMLDFTSIESYLPGFSEKSNFLKMWRVTRDWMRERGLDLTTTPFRVACFGHAINGGLFIDENGETSIQNLFAAGEVAGGPHGADRLGGNMLVTCQVFGRRAGQSAAQRAENDTGHGHDSLITKILRGLSIRPDSKRPDPKNKSQHMQELKNIIKDLLWRNFLVVKTEGSLNKCIEELNRLEAEFHNEAGVSNSFWDVKNMRDTARLMVWSALERQESRGSHYRADFSEMKPEGNQSLEIWRDRDNMKIARKNFPSS
jgi:fumarate reductase (CoM/CoB) subunit A